MESINNYTLREFFKRRSKLKYQSVLFSLKPKNNFLGLKMSLDIITYKDLRILEKEMKKHDGDLNSICRIFCIAFGCNERDFWEAKIIEFYSCQNFLIKAVEAIRANESKLLSSINVDADIWLEAGGDALNAFGDLLPLMKLGKIYSLFPYDLENRPYNQILHLLVAHKREEEVKARYSDLKKSLTPKHK